MNQIRRADRRTSKLKYPLEAMRGNKTNRLRKGYENEMEMVAACVLKYSKRKSYFKNKGFYLHIVPPVFK